MIAFTVLTVQVIVWQNSDISVSIVSETAKGNSEVTISVLNTAGSTLLFYESTEMTGKIEFLSDSGWVEYCDVYYTNGNVDAISTQYGGTFAELEPGENWKVSVPKDKVLGMKDGTYRIKMTYITERQYNDYLEDAFDNRENESDVVSKEDMIEVSKENSKIYPDLTFINGKNKNDKVKDEVIEEEFIAQSRCEVFIKTFEYTAPEDFVDEISINDSHIESDGEIARSVKP